MGFPQTTLVSPRHLLHSPFPACSSFPRLLPTKTLGGVPFSGQPPIRVRTRAKSCPVVPNPPTLNGVASVGFLRLSRNAFLSHCHSRSLGSSEAGLCSVVHFLAFSSHSHKRPKQNKEQEENTQHLFSVPSEETLPLPWYHFGHIVSAREKPTSAGIQTQPRIIPQGLGDN